MKASLVPVILVPSYCAEAKALFAQMTTPPDRPRKAIINRFIVALKAAGVWAKLDALYVLAAHTTQAGKLNWVNPSQTALAESGTGTWTVDREWAGNGTTGVLTGPTNLSAMTFYTQTNAHVACWVRANTVSSNMTVGTTGATCFLRPHETATTFSGRASGNASSSANPISSSLTGLFMATRPDTSNQALHTNGSQFVTGAIASAARPASPLTIGAGNSTFSPVAVSLVSIGAELAAESANYYTAAARFMSDIGA